MSSVARKESIPIGTEQIHTYCAMCTSRCGVLATVQDGVLTQVNADPDHPNGCICVKGTAAPEIVYSPDRLQFPMVRTRPKGDPNPGWVRVTWEQALNLAALRLNDIKENYGSEAVVFSRATTAGSAAIDYDGWLQRLANAFGSPNLLTSNHICTWNRRVGSKYTYGVGMPLPDFDSTKCMLIWGVNPPATSPAQALRLNRARNRGAKLIVIDPRRTTLAAKADCWLRVRPGTDGELAMAMLNVLIEENLFDGEFARRWTNGPFLVRCDNNQLITERDLQSEGSLDTYLVWDEHGNAPGTLQRNTSAALFGTFTVQFSDGTPVTCKPALQRLKDIAIAYAPELSEKVTTVPAAEVRKAVRLFAAEKPSSYCTWVGLEQDNDAMQTNRAVCCFYALTGQFDQRGSNVLFATTPTNPIYGRELLPKDKAELRIGVEQHPLGPPTDPGLVQAAEVYEAILTSRPYPIKAMIAFGTDPLLGHGDSLRGKTALEGLEFYIHVDTIVNPSANFADLLLPAASCWEREALMTSFEVAEDTLNWAQLRPAVAKPVGESRSDVEIIFDLAKRLGLSEQFFDGDLEAALNHQLAPSNLSVQELKQNPVGLRANVTTSHQKYAEIDAQTGKPSGFDTPTRKIEIYSTSFANAGYAPLPVFDTSAHNDTNERYPLTLTFYRLVQFCGEQHRNIPRLRRSAPDPSLEIHPQTAKAQRIEDGEWISLETESGKVRLKAKFNDSLHPQTVATVYGWWQACQELKVSGHDPFSETGANANLLVPNADIDPISASVAHRAQKCRVRKENIS
ncbi:MAG: molybdopterin-containing oxidoreductase family protein [Candidatus Binatia bacterium]